MNYNLYKAILPNMINNLNEDDIAYIDKYEDLINVKPNITKLFFVSNFLRMLFIDFLDLRTTHIVFSRSTSFSNSISLSIYS